MFDAARFNKRECLNRSLARCFSEPPLPEDTTKFVLLRTVYQRVGSIRFGSAWTGIEMEVGLAASPPVLHEVIEPSLYETTPLVREDENSRPATWVVMPETKDMDYACRLLSAESPMQKTKWQQWRRMTVGSQPPPFTVGEWRRAQVLADMHHDSFGEAMWRHYEVTTELRRVCAEGGLMCVLRPIYGGKFGPELPSWIWNTERHHNRFNLWRMNRDEIINQISDVAPTDWIFCERLSFEALCNRLVIPPVENAIEPGGHPYLSEFMICALQVSKALGMSPEHQPKKEIVIGEVRRLWRGTDPISDTMAERIASVVRSLDSQGGRNSKQQKKA